jgi:hypothetical protein
VRNRHRQVAKSFNDLNCPTIVTTDRLNAQYLGTNESRLSNGIAKMQLSAIQDIHQMKKKFIGILPAIHLRFTPRKSPDGTFQTHRR